MTLIRNLLITLSLLPTLAYAEPYWASKPVQCGPLEEVKSIVKQHGEVAILGAMAQIVVDPNELNSISQTPIYLFYSQENRTYTLIEFNFQNEEACVVSWGNGVDFDVQKYFDSNS